MLRIRHENNGALKIPKEIISLPGEPDLPPVPIDEFIAALNKANPGKNFKFLRFEKDLPDVDSATKTIDEVQQAISDLAAKTNIDPTIKEAINNVKKEQTNG